MESKSNRWSLHPTYDQLQNAIETLNAGLTVRTANGKILYANDRLLGWLGYSPEELDGQDALLFVPDELKEATEEEMREIVTGDERSRIGVLKRKDGRTMPVVWAPHVLRDGEDVLAVVTVVMALGDVQTAKRVSAGPAQGLSSSLEKIAHELNTISLFAAGPMTEGLPHNHPDLAVLSAREREILSELISGLRVPAIAKKLFISPHTVRNHLKSMYRKLDVPDQAGLIERIRARRDEMAP